MPRAPIKPLESAGRNLTYRQRAFINAYLGPANGNPIEACRMAGYSETSNNLRQMADRLLADNRIKERIGKRIDLITEHPMKTVEGRTSGYIQRLNQLATIVQERADDDQYHRDGGRYEPGARSGWLARKVKIQRRYDRKTGELMNETEEVEYKFDAALAREVREIEKQIAIELRQWSEKRELSGPDGAPISIQEIEVVKQIIPAEFRTEPIDADYTEIPAQIPADDVQDAQDELSDTDRQSDIIETSVSFNGWGFDDDD